MSTKNTILKQYDGRFLQIFQEIYEQACQLAQPQAAFHLQCATVMPCRKNGRSNVMGAEQWVIQCI